MSTTTAATTIPTAPLTSSVAGLKAAAIGAWIVVFIVPLIGMIWASVVSRGLQSRGASSVATDNAMRVAAVLFILETLILLEIFLPLFL